VRRFLAVGLLLGVFSFGTPGHAASDSPATLSFEAPCECPNRDYFWHQLWSRSVALSHAGHAVPQLALDVRIEQFGTSYSGVVRLRDAAGAAVERRVSGPVCVDVTMAQALATAIVRVPSHLEFNGTWSLRGARTRSFTRRRPHGNESAASNGLVVGDGCTFVLGAAARKRAFECGVGARRE
jgi:hypothetical protein